MSKEDKQKFVKLARGSSKTLTVDPKSTLNVSLSFTNTLDYKFNSQTKYFIQISKIISSVDEKREISHILDNIEIKIE